ncbi:S8 family serine peptidase [Ammoniphilus sp. CFH 90114]|uniref:S8 family serine peptidase n=1 Tax=Ammoniphilus sp. CFH 90114 TaxID=2493665 RepID=UPI00100F663E|nr:S8 family serine peptidase [Ammoniphilus sp. CFH 90114]RXT04494.1 serine protease [Ammoniphilus sp. CFH 90114]
MLRTSWLLAICSIVTISTVHANPSTLPSDPYVNSQHYHQQINTTAAWQEIRENTDITIAILDTGVDVDHPDLKANLVQGYNLVQPDKPPHDDHGHGTATAGILGAVGDNGIGVTGVLWNAKMMPIKILDNKGGGDAGRVAKGIRLAVDKGAKIILLSLGDPIYSTEMEKAIQYAEDKGVLLIAATGNDSSTVSYPAAFPTVLSVSAVDAYNIPLSYANRGPEVDVVAPGHHIYSTAKDGKYAYVSGTSMAAPQVAGMAALLLKKAPSLTPLEVRMIIRASTEGVDTKGWNPNTGYGLVNVQKALSLVDSDPIDLYEPNQTIEQVASLPFVGQTQALIGKTDPVDWYQIELPYQGKFQLQTRSLTGKENVLQIEIYNGEKKKVSSGLNRWEGTLKGGTYHFRVMDTGETPSFPYHIDTSFSVGADPYEDNDTKAKASKVPISQQQLIRGTFHKRADVDWFVADYLWPGKLEVEVKTDTIRMDSVLTIEQVGKTIEKVDHGSVSNGQSERWSKTVDPGKFYFALQEYYGNAVNGQYELQIRYETSDTSAFRDIQDHWARTSIEDLVSRKMIQGYPDYTFRPNHNITRAGAAAVLQNVLQLPTSRATSTYQDLKKDHWVYSAIASLGERGIFKGVASERIFPDQPLTRAELAVLLYQARYGTEQPEQIKSKQEFTDVLRGHWAYPYIMKMAELQHIQGFQDGSFQPERQTTRAEFAVLVRNMWYPAQ